MGTTIEEGDFVPITSYDVITRAHVDWESKKNPTCVIYFLFFTRVVIRNLFLFTRQSASKSKLDNQKNRRRDRRPFRDLGANFFIPPFTSTSHPRKRAYDAHIHYRHNHIRAHVSCVPKVCLRRLFTVIALQRTIMYTCFIDERISLIIIRIILNYMYTTTLKPHTYLGPMRTK